MFEISEMFQKKGIECITTSGYSNHPIQQLKEDNRFVGGMFSKGLYKIFSYVSGIDGIGAPLATIKLLRSIHPDLIHLHNLHGWYINWPILFRYIKKHNIPVIWTLHDCWAFTGRCPHFLISKCDSWKTDCSNCKYAGDNYPNTLINHSKLMRKLKEQWFSNVKCMKIVTPSMWLSDLTKESFLKQYDIKVINNGIDLNVFKPVKSNFRVNYGFEDKKIILGVSFGWNIKKGLDVFINLAENLKENYQIILVGTDDVVDKMLPANILSIHRTQNQQELVEIYSSADVFVNPTREENYPSVNMEALACGTPVITFDTGGSSEILNDTCGIVIPVDDVDSLRKAISFVCNEGVFNKQDCLKRAEEFDKKKRYEEYFELYEEIINEYS